MGATFLPCMGSSGPIPHGAIYVLLFFFRFDLFDLSYVLLFCVRERCDNDAECIRVFIFYVEIQVPRLSFPVSNEDMSELETSMAGERRSYELDTRIYGRHGSITRVASLDIIISERRKQSGPGPSGGRVDFSPPPWQRITTELSSSTHLSELFTSLFFCNIFLSPIWCQLNNRDIYS